MEHNNVINKIKHLLNLSKSSNKEEASLAAKLADNIIQKYRISIQELQTNNNVTTNILPSYKSKNIDDWKIILLQKFAKNYGCMIISKSFNKENSFYLVGTQEDIDITNSMYEWFVAKIEILADLNTKTLTSKKSYCTGACVGVCAKIDDSNKEIIKFANENKKELVLQSLSKRLDNAKEYIQSNYSQEEFKLNVTIKNNSFYNKGFKDGYSLRKSKEIKCTKITKAI